MGFPAKAFPTPLQVHDWLDQPADVDDEVASLVELPNVNEPWDHLLEDKVDDPHQVTEAEGHQDRRNEVDGSGLQAAVPLASPLPWSWLPQGRKDAHIAEEHHRHEGDAPNRQDPFLEIGEEYVQEDGQEDNSPGRGSHCRLYSKTPVPEVQRRVHHGHKVLHADAALQQRAPAPKQGAVQAIWQVQGRPEELGEEGHADEAVEDLEGGQVELEELPDQLPLGACGYQPHDVAVGGQTENDVDDHDDRAKWTRQKKRAGGKVGGVHLLRDVVLCFEGADFLQVRGERRVRGDAGVGRKHINPQVKALKKNPTKSQEAKPMYQSR